MNKEALLNRVDKIFRANTIEVEVVVGQFDQTKLVKKIRNINELKDDIKDLISNEFNIGKIDMSEVFIGNRKLGASYSIEIPIEVAKVWGYKYVAWNGGRIYDLNCKDMGICYDEL